MHKKNAWIRMMGFPPPPPYISLVKQSCIFMYAYMMKYNTTLGYRKKKKKGTAKTFI